MSLNDTLPQVLPEELALSADLQTVTLEELATHRSGLPRLPVNIAVDLFTKRYNPYAGYTLGRLENMLPLAATFRLPDNRPSYSNFGMGLLGDALALRNETTYADLIQRQVLAPLKLNDTFTAVPESKLDRFINGRFPNGKVAPHWDFQARAGAGAMRSTAADLLTFLEANISPPDSPLGEAIRLTHQPRWEEDGDGIALGWHLQGREQDRSGQRKSTAASKDPEGDVEPSEVDDDGSRIYWHNGGTGGFVSFAAFHTPSRTAIVLLSDSGDAMEGRVPTDRIAAKIHERLIDDALQQ